MVLDTSAIVAILFDEAEADSFRSAVAMDPVRLVSAANALAAAIVVEARAGEPAGRELDLLFHVGAIEVVAVSAEHFEVARRASRRFGKGRHPAALNFGDCFSYALSQTSGEPLLCKGGDFSVTDVRRVDAAWNPVASR